MIFRLYPLIIALQIYCLYHAYTNRADSKWYWIIFFFPFLGSVFYIYENFYNRRNIENLKEGVKGALVKNYSLDKLEQKVQFADTYANRLELASEHLKYGNIDRAIEIYESCNVGPNKNDTHLIILIIRAYFLKEDYNSVIAYGEQILGEKDFDTSSAKTDVAWSYHYMDNPDMAEALFCSMDKTYANYEKRLEYAYFLYQVRGTNEATVKAEELMEEIQAMDSYESRLNKAVIKDIKHFYKNVKKER